ncbi:hypothetical protein Bca52824_046479 [Brassica carinata]|uniref:Uncharacterized protein n=1 Tax=Brassica carinata TaxID=52824 RepID=A0A8X7UP31_BRACI|nr:hypothetical protein Bca52824_046479 [Brassica carinata]
MELVVATLLPMVLVIGGVNAGAVVRNGKKEVADAYNKILVSVKEKFSKKILVSFEVRGLAAIMRHLKRVGCPLPALKDLTNRDEYLDIAHWSMMVGQPSRLYLFSS